MLSPLQLQQRADVRFADNEFLNITEKSFRDFAADLIQTFVAQAVANVPDYEPGRDYAPHFLIRHDFGGAAPVFLAADANGGVLPAPTDPAGDASWAPALSPAGPGLSQVGTVDALRYLQGDWVPGRLYVLINRLDAQLGALPDVCVRALSASELEPTGYLVDGVTTPQLVSYDLATDTTQSPALSYTQATIDAMLAGLRDGLQDVPIITRDEAIAKMYPAAGLTSTRYIVSGLWNGNVGAVALFAATKGRFHPLGILGSGNDAVVVLADVRTGTYTLLSDLLPKAVGTGTGRNVTFDQERHWPVISTGTYLVDATGAQRNVCFELVLAQGCDDIKIPTTGFVKVSPGLFDAARENTYWFCVRLDGVVQYAITQAY